MKARKIKATFEIREDSSDACVEFYIGGKKSKWNALTAKEQIKMLNAWAVFYRFLKDD